MSIQIMSDLHLEMANEYATFHITPTADYLGLLGDIGNVVKHKEKFFEFITRQLLQFKAVLFVPGNHEAYHSNWEDTLATLRSFEMEERDKSMGKFILLHRERFPIPGTNTIVLGCSLFSRVPSNMHIAMGMRINDFHAIEGWTTDMHNEEHWEDVSWLNRQIVDIAGFPEDDIIILTHWSPTRHRDTVNPAHAMSPLTCAFATDLSLETCFVSDQVKIWAFGHSHYNCDVIVDKWTSNGTMRMVSNQRGFPEAQTGDFDIGKVISVSGHIEEI
ncbi:hypothetical protein S7711_03086 [Stachybotrys chartarum IBT 7711]|uniref:Calcineurin-like phosphoesterase domain-containing protein n=1 Tax=Stachybotrys chartarum (strain CBS 109288 / IBT 7711) TaxID=1280523 RepID=A0A084B8A0_STACB|nr:hypothetical protein S7711_03086 [Stachybotrys chartarum IBT 7711]KFA54097.1 hypothetical protein S40293_05554 [Stachybotrys chartarum IBT 40293]